jgi:hypothetical protein
MRSSADPRPYVPCLDQRTADVGAPALTPAHNDSGHIRATIIRRAIRSPTIDNLDVTRRLVAAGEILGIVVLDHIVVGDGRYFSFKEAGRL